MTPKFKIGDQAWCASVESVEKRKNCPECFGLKFLTVIMGDQSEVTIDCAGCASGYNPPRGYVTYHAYEPKVEEVFVHKIEITSDKISYWTRHDRDGSGCYSGYDEDKLCATRESAEIRSLELAEDLSKAELMKIEKKEKPSRTWAWNVHYHRDCIRKAEKDLAYHKSKLEAARPKAKEEKSGGLA